MSKWLDRLLVGILHRDQIRSANVITQEIVNLPVETQIGSLQISPMNACLHDIFEDGPRVPLRYGSAPTDKCVMCGAWRTTHHVPGPWKSEDTLVGALTESDDL